MYSENNEQEIIEKFFPKRNHGLLLDIGANQGVSGSNSLGLLERGWQGVLVEPNHQKYTELIKNYKERKILSQIIAVNNAIVPNYFNTNAVFYDTKKHDTIGHGLGSFNKSWVEQWVKHLNSREQSDRYTIIENTIQPIKVKDFFNQYGFDFNFITIDVELLNLELSTSIDWHKFNRLELICIEADDNTEMSKSRFECLFNQFGFKLLCTDSSGLNLFFSRNKY